MEEFFGVNDGHTISGPGTGAIGRIIESEHTRLVGAEVRRLLKLFGYKVKNCTVDYAKSTNDSLALIVKLANDEELTFFIAIHFNAGGGRGVEIYTYKGRQFKDALDVCKEISALGFRNRGVKEGTGLYVISKTKAKSMLIEVCFVDTDDVETYLRVGYKAIAKAIVKGITGKVVTENQESNKGESKLLNILKKCVVKRGSTGTEVYILQGSLIKLGYDPKGLDGKCGPGCEAAIAQYQKDNSLVVDKSCGPATWTSILTK